MFGTVARMKAKPGKEAEFLRLTEAYREMDIPGYIGEFVYRIDGEPDTYMLAVMFDSREAYENNADSPEQHERYLQYRELLAAEPEWQDGEVIFHHMA